MKSFICFSIFVFFSHNVFANITLIDRQYDQYIVGKSVQDGEYIYTTESGFLFVLHQIGDETSRLEEVVRLDLKQVPSLIGYGVIGIVVKQSRLFIVFQNDHKGILYTIDIADPFAPVVLDRSVIVQNLTGFLISSLSMLDGDRLFLLEDRFDSSVIYIIDVTNTVPVLINESTFARYTKIIAAHGVLYALLRNNGIDVLNVHSNVYPVLVTHLDLPAVSGYDIIADNDYVYVKTIGDHFVYNLVSLYFDGQQLLQISVINILEDVSIKLVLNNNIYLSGYGRIKVVDINDPYNMILAHTDEKDSSVIRGDLFAVLGDIIYAVEYVTDDDLSSVEIIHVSQEALYNIKIYPNSRYQRSLIVLPDILQGKNFLFVIQPTYLIGRDAEVWVRYYDPESDDIDNKVLLYSGRLDASLWLKDSFDFCCRTSFPSFYYKNRLLPYLQYTYNVSIMVDLNVDGFLHSEDLYIKKTINVVVTDRQMR